MMRHIVEHKMQQKAQGKDEDAIVVIDPHSDLVHGLMELCPPEIADKVRIIDLGDAERVVGINLLDTEVFRDRDLTCDGIVRVAKGLWDNWGSRMQNILEHLVKSMHEANALSDGKRSEQYTLLDGHDMLGISAKSDAARRKMLSLIDDPYLSRWWNNEFKSWDKRMQVEACAPVQTRLAPTTPLISAPGGFWASLSPRWTSGRRFRAVESCLSPRRRLTWDETWRPCWGPAF